MKSLLVLTPYVSALQQQDYIMVLWELEQASTLTAFAAAAAQAGAEAGLFASEGLDA